MTRTGRPVTAPAGPPTPRSRRRRAVHPLLLFSTAAVVLHVIVATTNTLFASTQPGDDGIPGGPVLVGWLHFDSGWYISIAENGYSWIHGQQSSVAFFPAYPLSVRALASFGVSPYIAGHLLTLAAGAAVGMLWWRWLGTHLPASSRPVAFALLLLYPYAWFLYGTAYSDATFLALTMAAFVFVDQRRWGLAALAGGIATATRPVAPAVVIGLLAVALDRSGAIQRIRDGNRWRWRFNRDQLRPQMLLVALSGTGLVLWCAWLWYSYDDPFAFMTVQSAPGWQQGAGPHTWFKVGFFELLFGRHLSVMKLLPQAIGVLGSLALVPAVARRFGWGYGVYVLVVVGIPALGSGDFMGTGRYLLAAFPVFALIGEWLAARPQRWLAPAVLTVGATGLCLGAGAFGAGNYLT